EARRKQEEAEALARQKAAADEAARRQAAEAEAARRQAAEAEAARRKAAEAEAARQQQEQEAAERRHKRATTTRNLSWADTGGARSRMATTSGMTCASSVDYDGVDGSGKFRRWAAGNHAAAAATYVVLVDGAEPTSVHVLLKRDEESEFLIEISNFTRNN